jgi:hypothetical protein
MRNLLLTCRRFSKANRFVELKTVTRRFSVCIHASIGDLPFSAGLKYGAITSSQIEMFSCLASTAGGKRDDDEVELLD